MFNANAARPYKRWVQRTLLQAIESVTQEEQKQQCKAAAVALFSTFRDIIGPTASEEQPDEPAAEDATSSTRDSTVGSD